MINIVLYAMSIVANLAMGPFYSAMMVRLFQIDDEEWHAEFLRGIVNYKLLIIMLGFVPWLTLVIMTG